MAEGRKDDQGKVRFDLISIPALWELARVLTMGAKKYEDRNWEQGIKYSRVIAALLRHFFKWCMGEKYDIKDGQHHLGSVIWCTMVLLHFDLNPEKYKDFDNRVIGLVRPWEEEELDNDPQISLFGGGD